jgi:muramidase (phage lysozyme)
MNTLAQENLALSRDPNVRAMLDAIAAAEGVKHGYNTAFGNTPLKSLADHPRIKKGFTETSGKKNQTTAAGRYQFLADTWDGLRKELKLTDFGPESQDAAAVQLLRKNGSLQAVLAGDFKTAIDNSGTTWASLPSSKYAQPKRSWEFMEKQLGAPVQNPYPDATSVRTAKTAEDTRPVGVMGKPMSTKQAATLAMAEMNQGLPAGALGQSSPDNSDVLMGDPAQGNWQQALASLQQPQGLMQANTPADSENMMQTIKDQAAQQQDRALGAMFADVGEQRNDTSQLPTSIDRYLDKLLSA